MYSIIEFEVGRDVFEIICDNVEGFYFFKFVCDKWMNELFYRYFS